MPKRIRLPIFIKRLAYMMPNKITFYLRFLWKHGYWPNINNPRSMIEKILWLMVWDENPLRAKMVDRIKVREFVQENSPTCKSPKQLWIGESLTLDVWNDLPKEFVIKANHGSHMIDIVDKHRDSFEKIFNSSRKWLLEDYSLEYGEWAYKDVPRMLIVEEKLSLLGKLPPDWKFFCSNGKVLMVQVDMNRFERHVRNLYTPNFSRIHYISQEFPPGPEIEKPRCFEKAIRIAEQLSAPLDFIRVDLYLIDNTVYFGEMTCYPGAGTDPVESKDLDFELGSQIKLNKCVVILSWLCFSMAYLTYVIVSINYR